jgi:hypothetical protein
MVLTQGFEGKNIVLFLGVDGLYSLENADMVIIFLSILNSAHNNYYINV